MRELTGLRTEKAKIFRLNNGKHLMRVHGRPLHYWSPGQGWQDLDLTISPDTSVSGYDRSVTKAPYRFRFARTAVQPQRFEIPNRGWITYRAQGVNPAQAAVSGNTAVYANAWNDVDLELAATPRAVKETLVIKNPTGGVMTFSWELGLHNLTAEAADGGIRYLYTEENNTYPVAVVHRPRVEGEDRYGAFAIRQQGGKTYLDLSLDTAGLAGPVRLDPTTQYYATASDGLVSHTGTTYSTVQAAVTGTTANDTNANSIMGQWIDGADYYLYRQFFYFGTSGLGASAVIDSATFYFYLASDGSTTDFDITLVQGTQADPLTTADFDSCGTTSGGSLTTNGISTAAYSTIALNSTAIGWINQTGTTLLALRSSRDISATAPTGYERVYIYHSEQTGTANDPYLEIVYDTLTVVLQPSDGDTYLREGVPDSNLGSAVQVGVFDLVNAAARSPLKFDLSRIPAGATITAATLKLYYYTFANTDPNGKTVWAYKLTQSAWVETQATWNVYSTGNSWTAAGGDFVTSSPAGGSTTFPAAYGWMSWDVTAIVDDAYADGGTAHMLVKFATEGLASGDSEGYWHSNNYTANTSLGPKLEVTYTVATASKNPQMLI